MNPKINKRITDLNEQLNFINLEIDDVIKRSEKSIEIIVNALNNLKKLIVKYNLKSQNEEILFFKEVKPIIFSKLIYNTSVLRIEKKRPKGTDSSKKKYLLNELDNLNRYFDANLDFYQYIELVQHF